MVFFTQQRDRRVFDDLDAQQDPLCSVKFRNVFLIVCSSEFSCALRRFRPLDIDDFDKELYEVLRAGEENGSTHLLHMSQTEEGMEEA